jgi:hypothetical protein
VRWFAALERERRRLALLSLADAFRRFAALHRAAAGGTDAG